MSQNFMTGDPLSLDRIRSVLVRLEDTIIFSLIERAQFAHNPRIYQRGAFKELEEVGFSGSWLDWFLKETEAFHGMCSTAPSHKRTRLIESHCSQSTQIHKVR
jgi:chorismate mutase